MEKNINNTTGVPILMNQQKLEELAIKERLEEAINKSQYEGGWAEYAVYCGGEADTGVAELDEAIEALYDANERVHYLANKLALRYDLEF
ncbi:hypothetical protein [Xanthomonas phage DES1]|nr:hypothetical protein [Xanthomonas phage DES1]